MRSGGAPRENYRRRIFILLTAINYQLTDFSDISLMKNHGNGKPLSMITPRTHAGPWRRAAAEPQDGLPETWAESL